MRRVVSLLSAIFPLVLLFIAEPQQAHAITVTTQECAVIAFPCPAGSIMDTGVHSDGINLLAENSFDFGAFAFSNARVGFTGTVTVTDSGGVFDALLGTGVATEAAGVGAEFLDVDIHQNYVTDPTIVGFIGGAFEFNIGTCNAAAGAAGSYNQATLVADGTVLPIMGGPGDCAGGAFAFAGGSPVVITQPVSLDALVQFGFGASGALQTIDLPLGEDVAPEPASLLLMGGGLICVTGSLRRRTTRLR